MVEGPIHIYLFYKEPENKNVLWLRPYLDREGYELLYFGAKGWTPLIMNCCDKYKGDINTNVTEESNNNLGQESNNSEDSNMTENNAIFVAELCQDSNPCNCNK